MNEELNKLKYLLNKGKSKEEIIYTLNIDENKLSFMMQALINNGYYYTFSDNKAIKGVPIDNKLTIDFGNFNMICLISDVHGGSKYDCFDNMNALYNLCDYLGVNIIICAGDFTDGYYPDRKLNQKVIGFDQTVDYIINNHPYSSDINFYTISGNHDDSFEDDIIEKIAMYRSDIKYLGKTSANISLGDKKIIVNHGVSYNKNMNYRLNYFYKKIPDEEKPNILHLGHIHSNFEKWINNTLIIQSGSFMNPSYRSQMLGNSNPCTCIFVNLDDIEHITYSKYDFENGRARLLFKGK